MFLILQYEDLKTTLNKDTKYLRVSASHFGIIPSFIMFCCNSGHGSSRAIDHNSFFFSQWLAQSNWESLNDSTPTLGFYEYPCNSAQQKENKLRSSRCALPANSLHFLCVFLLARLSGKNRKTISQRDGFCPPCRGQVSTDHPFKRVKQLCDQADEVPQARQQGSGFYWSPKERSQYTDLEFQFQHKQCSEALLLATPMRIESLHGIGLMHNEQTSFYINRFSSQSGII